MIKQAIKWLSNDFKELSLQFKILFTVGSMRLIKRKANKLMRKTNEQIFVVKSPSGKLRYVSKYQFQQMRQAGIFPLSFTSTNLGDNSLYYTRKPRPHEFI